jgi:hypothetical protein
MREGSRVLGASGLDGFDRGRKQIISDIRARDLLADKRTTLILGLNANVHKPSRVQHPLQVVE